MLGTQDIPFYDKKGYNKNEGVFIMWIGELNLIGVILFILLPQRQLLQKVYMACGVVAEELDRQLVQLSFSFIFIKSVNLNDNDYEYMLIMKMIVAHWLLKWTPVLIWDYLLFLLSWFSRMLMWCSSEVSLSLPLYWLLSPSYISCTGTTDTQEKRKWMSLHWTVPPLSNNSTRAE